MRANRTKRAFACLAAAAALVTLLVGCEAGGPTPTAAPPAVPPTATGANVQAPTPGASNTPAIPSATSSPTALARKTPVFRQVASFSDYNPEPVTVKPSLNPYTIEPGLANVVNRKDFQLRPGTVALIEKNGFAAQFPNDTQYKQFYQLYESGRYAESPVFITTDSLLHVFHLMFDKVLRTTETVYLTGYLKTLTTSMLQSSQAQYDALKGTAGDQAARRNLAYFSVASRLLDPNTQVPAAVQPEVSQELHLIDNHEGVSRSAIMGYDEDYGQYKPRGHYTRSEELQNYFRAMMWYGRITFRAKEADETRSAILLTEALQSTKTTSGTLASALWAHIYDPTVFFVGGSDDLSYRDYAPLVTQVFGADAGPRAILDDAGVARFQALADALPGPMINSVPGGSSGEEDDLNKGLRMMGQRFTLDEYAFGQLLWANVGTRDQKRVLPKGLDFPAAMGSQAAYSILDQMGETAYAHYPEQMKKVQGEIASLPTPVWTQNLYWSWLYAFQPLLQPKALNSGYPSFMTNDTWTRKDLNTVLGSWTELKHDTILYAKQVLAEMGGGPPQLTKGYVEPEPEFYARVGALASMARTGLYSRGLIDKSNPNQPREIPSDYGALEQIEQLALDLKHISEKELQGVQVTGEEYALIQYYGGTLEHLTNAAADPQDPPQIANGDLNDQDAAVVADVATGGSTALEEATGRIVEIYVVCPVEGQLVIARGGIYSQYEFMQPSSNRLTDEQWRQRLDNNQAPPLAGWLTYLGK